MAGLFDDQTFSFYGGDVRLAQSLGIADESRWQGKDLHAGVLLGTARRDDYEIDVTVSAWPAQFWDFLIRKDGVDQFFVSTDSGTLAEYWPLVEQLLAEGDVAPDQRRLVEDRRPELVASALGPRARLSPLARA